jgi:hypothetical protein
MEPEATDRIEDRSVAFIPNHWMASFSAVDADLVFPSCFQGEFEKRILCRSAEYAEVGDRLFSCWRRGDRKIFPLFEKSAPGARVAPDPPLDDREIDSFDIVPFKEAIKLLFRPLPSGEEEDARRFPVDPVHSKDLVGLVVFPEEAQGMFASFPTLIEGNR